MDAIEATAEVFLTAFHVLTKKEKKSVVDKLLKDKEFMEDLTDIVDVLFVLLEQAYLVHLCYTIGYNCVSLLHRWRTLYSVALQ